MNTENNDTTELALVNSVASEKLTEMTLDLAEVAFDSVLKDGIFKDIPYFGTIYKTIQAGIGIKDRIFAKKVYRFLFEIKDIPAEKREKFIKELQDKEGAQQKAGETLLILLDRLDHLEKPKIIARLLKAKIKGEISIDDFLRLSFIVDRCFIHDLKHLENYSQGEVPEPICETLVSLGLLVLLKEGQPWFDSKAGRPKKTRSYYSISPIGEMLVEYGLKPYSD